MFLWIIDVTSICGYIQTLSVYTIYTPVYTIRNIILLNFLFDMQGSRYYDKPSIINVYNIL